MHRRCGGGHNLNRENSRLIGVIRLTDERCNPDNKCKITFYQEGKGRTSFIVTFSNLTELKGILNILDNYLNAGREAKTDINGIFEQLNRENSPSEKITTKQADTTQATENEDRDDAKQNPLLSLPDEVLSTLRITTSSGKIQGHAYVLSSKGKIFLKSLYIQECVNSIIKFFEGLPDEKKSIVRLKITNNILSLLEVQQIKEVAIQSLKAIRIKVIDSQGRSLNFEEDGVTPSPYVNTSTSPKEIPRR